jgi:hypothetical protein
MGQADQARTLSAIAGARGLRALGPMLKAGSEKLEQFEAMLLASEGAAEKMAAIMEDNLIGDLIILKSALSGVAISAWKPMAEGMRKVVQMLTEMAGSMEMWARDNSKWLADLAHGFSKGLITAVTIAEVGLRNFGVVSEAIGTWWSTQWPQVLANAANAGTYLSIVLFDNFSTLMEDLKWLFTNGFRSMWAALMSNDDAEAFMKWIKTRAKMAAMGLTADLGAASERDVDRLRKGGAYVKPEQQKRYDIRKFEWAAKGGSGEYKDKYAGETKKEYDMAMLKKVADAQINSVGGARGQRPGKGKYALPLMDDLKEIMGQGLEGLDLPDNVKKEFSEKIARRLKDIIPEGVPERFPDGEGGTGGGGAGGGVGGLGGGGKSGKAGLQEAMASIASAAWGSEPIKIIAANSTKQIKKLEEIVENTNPVATEAATGRPAAMGGHFA